MDKKFIYALFPIVILGNFRFTGFTYNFTKFRNVNINTEICVA